MELLRKRMFLVAIEKRRKERIMFVCEDKRLGEQPDCEFVTKEELETTLKLGQPAFGFTILRLLLIHRFVGAKAKAVILLLLSLKRFSSEHRGGSTVYRACH